MSSRAPRYVVSVLCLSIAGIVTVPAAAQNKPLLDCLCTCAIDPGGRFCGVTQSCFYNPEPNCGSTPGCSDPSRGECINTIACSVPCNRTPYSHAFGAPGDDAATTAARAQCRDDCNRRFGGTPSPPQTPTRTATRAATPTATKPVVLGSISCGETVTGTLSGSDLDLFGDGTFADLYFFTLDEPTNVEVSMSGSGFDEFVWIADVSNPNDYEPIFQGSPPQGGLLQPGSYVAVANNTYPIPPGSYPYSMHMDCQATAPSTATRTGTRTATATRTHTSTATRTRTVTSANTATRTSTATGTRAPTNTATRTSSPTRTATRAPEVDRIVCGQQVAGVLDPSDEDYFGDGTWADLYDLHLTARSDVTIDMQGADFLPYLLVFAAADPDSVIQSNPRSLTVNLDAGDYVIVANNYDAVAPTTLPYTLSVDCKAEPTVTPSATATHTRTPSPTPSPSSTAPRPTGTRTPTFTPLPTATSTRTATIVACQVGTSGELGAPTGTGCTVPDLIADAIEVVQTVQDLDNNVPLVAGKPTFVRFHVHSSTGRQRTSAILEVRRGDPGKTTRLKPRPEYLSVGPNPRRGNLNDAFLFELDSELTEAGGVALTAILNPDDQPPELEGDRANNTKFTTVSFQEVRPMRLVLYSVKYSVAGVEYAPRPIDSWLLTSWLERTYPIQDLQVCPRTMSYPASISLPSLAWLAGINSALLAKAAWDLNHRIGSPSLPTACQLLPGNTHYYGMYSDGGFLNRTNLPGGLGFPEFVPFIGGVGSGAAGDPDHWEGHRRDKDDSIADEVGAHEIGHSYDLNHTGFCGGDIAPPFYYPYPGGYISPFLLGDEAIYGFDPAQPLRLLSSSQQGPPPPTVRAIYGPTRKDFMSYCFGDVWISDFHYHALFRKFRRTGGGASAHTAGDLTIDPGVTAGLFNSDWLLVVGSFDPASGTVVVNPLFVLPAASPLAARVAGEYAIVLRDDAGSELARYPFTPHEIHERPGPLDTVFFVEMVPYVVGTVEVDIEGASGLLHTVQAGEHTPTVRVTAPNGGEFLDADPIPVAWTADDADGDPLTFNVEYSADHGRNWELVEQNLTERRLALPRTNVAGSDQALVRVWASDGIHTGSDTSDAPFTVPNAVPDVEITAPADGAVIRLGHTVTLAASATDLDAGTMAREQLRWRSSIDGELGPGAALTISRLSQGRHTITFHADDGLGGIATDAITLHVVPDGSGCSGDCNTNRAVTIDELVLGVSMALGGAPMIACPAFDDDESNTVTVSELVAAVRGALEGCATAAGLTQYRQP